MRRRSLSWRIAFSLLFVLCGSLLLSSNVLAGGGPPGTQALPPPECTEAEDCSSGPKTQTFVMSKFYNDYSGTQGWGYHALLWKHYHTGVQYNKYQAYAPAMVVVMGDADWLNSEEARTPTVFASNPAGSWWENGAWNFKELAIGAASFMDRWNSPVYTNMNISGYSRGVVVRQVTFEIDNPFGDSTLAKLCGPYGWGQDVSQYPIDDMAEDCAFFTDNYFTVKEMVIAYWDSSSQYKTLTITGESSMQNYFNNYSLFIGDPGISDIPTFVIPLQLP